MATVSWKKIVSASFQAAVILMTAALVKAVVEAYGYPWSPSFQDELPAIATQLNKTLPHMLDNVTRFDKADAGPGNSFVYRYTLIGVGSDLDVPLLRTQVQKAVCAAPSMKSFREHGTTVKYEYQNQSGQVLALFSFVLSSC